MVTDQAPSRSSRGFRAYWGTTRKEIQFWKNFRGVLYFLLFILSVRALMIFFHFPAVLYETDFYNASVYGNADSFWFAYFGDILINTLLFFYCSFVIRQVISRTGGGHLM